MRTVRFQGTDLVVAPLALGSVNFGVKTTKKDAFRQMDRYSEVGNFIDTAHVYGTVPGAAATSLSERVIGCWLRERGMAGRMVISTKGGHPPLTGAFIPRLHREELQQDVNESLAHLGIDVIDLYFLHRDDVSIPVGEILETMEDFRRAGKIRYYGLSNWTLERVGQAHDYARARGLKGLCCNQLKWSLAKINAEAVADRTLVNMDEKTYSFHARTGLAAMAYTAVAKGWFAHLTAGTPVRQSARAIYDNPCNERILSELQALSRASGRTVGELSLDYFLFHPFPAVAIASFSNDAQLEEGLSMLKRAPDEALIRRLHALRSEFMGG